MLFLIFSMIYAMIMYTINIILTFNSPIKINIPSYSIVMLVLMNDFCMLYSCKVFNTD